VERSGTGYLIEAKGVYSIRSGTIGDLPGVGRVLGGCCIEALVRLGDAAAG